MQTRSFFNQQILQCQDEAYTLACYLLDDEHKAEAVVQAAVETAYRSFPSNPINCRRLILRQVIQVSREHKLPASYPGQPEYITGLCLLTASERVALTLIDVLGFDYPDAASIMQCSCKEIRHRLAQARHRLLMCSPK